ncbi:MAG: hypothetical protein ABFD82_16815 [Syntrophaceae bacterium]
MSFKFSQFNKKSFLIPHEGKKIELPKAWLYPPKDVEKDHDSYMSSFNYLKPVTSFRIDKDFVGLHLSSWDSMPPGSGSAMAGVGRDIFLVYGTKTRHIHPGILNLGITKARARLMGCFGATFHSFIIGDVNNDGLTDIGVKQERIWCEEESVESRKIYSMNGPYYKEYPIEWYIFRGHKWIRAPEFNGVQPKMLSQKMPLTGLTKSPIDFVREITKDKLKVIK